MGLEECDIIIRGKVRILVNKKSLHVNGVDNEEWSHIQWLSAVNSTYPEHSCGCYILCCDGVFYCPQCEKVVDFKVNIDQPEVKVIDV